MVTSTGKCLCLGECMCVYVCGCGCVGACVGAERGCVILRGSGDGLTVPARVVEQQQQHDFLATSGHVARLGPKNASGSGDTGQTVSELHQADWQIARSARGALTHARPSWDERGLVMAALHYMPCTRTRPTPPPRASLPITAPYPVASSACHTYTTCFPQGCQGPSLAARCRITHPPHPAPARLLMFRIHAPHG